MSYYMYILASRKHGTLYTGVTNNLPERVHQHKTKMNSGFTARYGVSKLVYYELYEEPHEAIRKEKQVKRWRRDWKIQAIEEMNPHWEDLSLSLHFEHT
ncbi:GIY-YIG nuclease family protein [Pseudovibrio brasiliensis]|uniref:GIY-YIG nuclease family protein n=1 Tax=Pseudovibrio brasiliensis TaxID=1898042 RepID=A0ABX8AT35_9HYPH|nr:GIY-YIG nuclease family protein [Pseudovibrio brasiliensis]QUS56351.1 GIY-YIG nuclease family protein [Pseudovibrio brasiliensis]